MSVSDPMQVGECVVLLPQHGVRGQIAQHLDEGK
jgi:hypothetical protein